jgi:hypothetical protein
VRYAESGVICGPVSCVPHPTEQELDLQRLLAGSLQWMPAKVRSNYQDFTLSSSSSLTLSKQASSLYQRCDPIESSADGRRHGIGRTSPACGCKRRWPLPLSSVIPSLYEQSQTPECVSPHRVSKSAWVQIRYPIATTSGRSTAKSRRQVVRPRHGSIAASFGLMHFTMKNQRDALRKPLMQITSVRWRTGV